MASYWTRCGICSKSLFFMTPDYPNQVLCWDCVADVIRRHQEGEKRKDKAYEEMDEIKSRALDALSAVEEVQSMVREAMERLEE